MLQAIWRFPLLFLSLFALIPRLYCLNSPLIGVHSWRQADTAAIARNFYAIPLTPSHLTQFFFPQVDWGGGGAAETEFPLYPAVVSGVYRLVGTQTAAARLVTIVFSLVGLYFLYRLVERCFNRSVAFWSALFYAILPMSVFYGRTVQPEALVMMSTLGGLYFFKRWTDKEKGRDLLFSWLFSAIAFLTKVLPLIYLGIPLLFLATVKCKVRIFRRLDLWIYAISLLGVTFAWYYHAHQIYLDTGLTFGFWTNSTNRYSWIDLLSFQFWSDILLRLIVRHFAVFSFIAAIIGLSYRRQKAEDYLWEVGLVSSLLANAIAPTSSYIHEYYQLPTMLYSLVFIGKVYDRTFSPHHTLAPVSSQPASYQRASSQIESSQIESNQIVIQQPTNRRISRACLKAVLVLTFVTGSLIYSIDYISLETANNSEIYYLSTQVQKYTPASSKVLATTQGDPTLLYLANRRGWLISPSEVSTERLSAARKQGADFLVGSYEVVQSYAPFEDEAQKERMRSLFAAQAQSTDSSPTTCKPLVDNERIFIAPLCK